MANKNSKESYARENEEFLLAAARREGAKMLKGGVVYEVLATGTGKTSPMPGNVVTVYYKGSLINGKTFDDNTSQGYPDAFRLTDLIVGWQIALKEMKAGDKWRIYIPAKYGYGSRGTSGIPKNSTLIFEIELVSVA